MIIYPLFWNSKGFQIFLAFLEIICQALDLETLTRQPVTDWETDCATVFNKTGGHFILIQYFQNKNISPPKLKKRRFEIYWRSKK